MLNPNIEQKLSRTVKELETLSEVEKNKVQRIFISDQVDENNLNVLPSNIEYDEVCNPYIFTKPCKYYWVKCEFDIVDKGNEHIKGFLSLDTKINRVASTIRPQGLLYLNGEIVQGIDINHIEVSLNVGHYEMMMLFYTHDIEDPFPLYVDVIYKDKRIEKAYYDFYIPLQTLTILDQKDDNYFKMLPALEKACNIIDFRNPYSLNFFDSLEKSLNYLNDNFYNSLCGSDLKVNVIGHSHIDVAWLWDYAQTREKVKRTFSTVLKLMDEYPEYKFMASTPQLYQFIKEDQPELYGKIKQKIEEGRWETEGGLWLECDCNLVSGESLVRQIVEGKRFFEKEFNVDSKIVWLPDVFGYSGNLPQIMSKAGIEKFVTAKIGWNDTNRFPYDTFIWKGIDGSKVDAFLISTPDKCNPRKGIYDITYTTYCPDVTANYILGTWHRYSQKDFNQTTFMTMGWGDGGGGVTKEMLEAQRRFAYGIPGIPKTEISTVKETLDEIKNNFDKSCDELHRIPTWTGELYFEFHRGTLTSVPMIKKYNRDAEILLQEAETVNVISNILFNNKYESELYEKNWKHVLLNQFHDVLPGSSIEEVYIDAKEILEKVREEVSANKNNQLDIILKNIKGNGLAIYNPNGFITDGVVNVNGKTEIVKDIPSYGYKLIKQNKENKPLFIRNKYLENNFYIIKFNKDGSINSLFDKRNNRELVETNKSFNQLVCYEDMAYEYDNWELAYFHKHKAYVLNDDALFNEIKEDHMVGFEIVKKYNNSVIKQTITIYDDFDRIDVKNDIVWNEKNQILKALFPLNLLFDEVNYDIQFGHVSRNNHHNTPYDSACFESVGHKWIDASENNYGFAILNDGKYGFGSEENVLSISLLKSGSFPFDGASEFIPSFTYSLYPHNGNLTNSDVIEKSYVLNRPLIGKNICSTEGNENNYSFIECNNRGVYIDTIKKAMNEDAYVLRLYEGYKENKQITLTFGHDFKECYVCDLLENKLESLEIKERKVTLNVKPFELVTLMVK